MSFFEKITNFFFPEALAPEVINDDLRGFLANNVSFYTSLGAQDRLQFEQRCLSFIHDTEFVGHDLEVSEQDKLLVASGSVILAWGFSKWHYVKVDTVILVPNSFNEHSKFGEADSTISGLVGSHYLAGKMILSQPALHLGFSIDNDKRNVAIHEFAHLIDMADGCTDGLPTELTERMFCLPWFDLVKKSIADIHSGKSDVRAYGGTNNVEFFAVVSEYFFERPKLFKRKHPSLYKSLELFYKQNRADVQRAIKVRKKSPCPCGSGRRYKRCCMP